jgi:hypothetical protein
MKARRRVVGREPEAEAEGGEQQAEERDYAATGAHGDRWNCQLNDVIIVG